MADDDKGSGSKTPLIVLVSGAPGSGKTTLAKQLAKRMRLLHIPRDDFFWSMSYTADQDIDRKTIGIPTYYAALAHLVSQGVSIVTDGTIYKGVSEPDILDNLAPVARIVNVHCRAEDEHKRFYDREVALTGTAPDWLEGHMQHLDKVYKDAVEPLDLRCQLIEVDTTVGYNPAIVEIANQIGDRNNKPRPTGPYLAS